MNEARDEVLALNQQLLDSIAAADWKTYQELCDPSMTCFEPEAQGQLIEGLAFHEFYFKLGPTKSAHHTTMASPHVRVGGDMAVVSYVRVNQRMSDGNPVIRTVEETRVWQKINGRWRHVHFHRSAPTR